MIRIYYLLILLLSLSVIHAQSIPLNVPETKAPAIDGVMSINEWENAASLPLEGGKSVYFQKCNDTLYVAIKAESGGFSSLAIGNRHQIKILHSSTSLITAAYYCSDSTWSLRHGFMDPKTEEGKSFARDEIKFTNIYRNAQLKQFSWYANLVEMGPPTETEFQIPISSLPDDELYLSAVFYQVKAETKIARLPATLSDGCVDRELISGTAKDGLQFSPLEWIQLNNLNTKE